MAVIAPDPTAASAPGWLGSFVEAWEPGTGAPIEDHEPATGRHIATVTGSTPDDVARAAAAAREAQPAWAETNFQERARILRRAADIYEANREEFGVWTMRETGASHSKMHHESNFAYGEILAAATLPWQPYGSLVPTAVKGRLSMIRRIPVGVVGADHAVELAERARDAGRGAGARARQRGRPQARSADAGHRRGDVRGGVPRGRAARGPAPDRRRRGRCRRGARHRSERRGRVVHRLDRRGSAGRRARRGTAQEGVTRARREQRVHRARRCRPRRRDLGRCLLGVPVPGPGLLRGRPPHRPRERRRRLRRCASRQGARASSSATRTARTSSSGRSSTRSRSAASTTSSGGRSTAARAS